jgi:hypothetical protein
MRGVTVQELLNMALAEAEELALLGLMEQLVWVEMVEMAFLRLLLALP